MAKIVLLEKIHASAAELLKAEGFSDIVQLPTALKIDDLKTASASVRPRRSRRKRCKPCRA